MRDGYEGKGEIKENLGFLVWEDEYLDNVMICYNIVVKTLNFFLLIVLFRYFFDSEEIIKYNVRSN